MEQPLEQGYYAKKQLFSKSGIIRWSHRARFENAVAKSADFSGLKVLDYGCGDATYFAMLLSSGHAPAAMVGAEIDSNLVELGRKRFASHPEISFVLQSDLKGPAHQGAYDAVVCMEVFEHLVDPDHFLELLHGFLKPGGRLLLSVPVEIGLPVLVKQTVRKVAGWRKIGDYASTLPYTWAELFRSVFAGPEQHIVRPRHPTGGGFEVHCHKGFNWRNLQRRIEKRFHLRSVSGSPVSWLPSLLASQVWFEAEKPRD